MNAYAAVPNSLKEIPQWVVWRYEETRDGKQTKIPYDAKSNGDCIRAKTNDPATWTTFERAAEVSDIFSGHDYNGIGFVLHDSGLVGLDFDGVLRDGAAEPFVLEILKLLENPYTEITPSGNGLRAFVRCAGLPSDKCKFSSNKYGAEIYSSGRYFTVTGNRFCGDCVPTIDDIGLVYFLVSKIQDSKFKKLWMADLSDYKNDQSRADLALLSILAREFNRDTEKIKKFFDASKLGERDKWRNRKDYRDASIKKALSGQNIGVSIPNIQSPIHELEFHLPAVEKVSHRDYVIAPAIGEKDGWFPRGAVSLVAGPSGASKTTWMLQLLIAQGIKAPFYGHDTFGRTYLMLGADRGEDAHKRTMERMNLSHATVPFKPLPLAWDSGAAQAIINQIEATEPLPEIVFVEGVDMMVTEVNNIKTVARFVHHLDKIAHYYHVALIGSLGSPKVKEGHGYSATRDNLLGSGGWGRTVETVALLQFPKNDDTNGRRNLTVALRNAPAEKFSLKFVDGLLEIDPASYEANDGAAQASQETDWYQEQARLAKVDPRKTWWTIRDMELALKLSHRTADRHVSNDCTKRIIRQKPGAKNGRGSAAEYRWNESSTNPLWIPEQSQASTPEQATF